MTSPMTFQTAKAAALLDQMGKWALTAGRFSIINAMSVTGTQRATTVQYVERLWALGIIKCVRYGRNAGPASERAALFEAGFDPKRPAIPAPIQHPPRTRRRDSGGQYSLPASLARIIQIEEYLTRWPGATSLDVSDGCATSIGLAGSLLLHMSKNGACHREKSKGHGKGRGMDRWYMGPGADEDQSAESGKGWVQRNKATDASVQFCGTRDPFQVFMFGMGPAPARVDYAAMGAA